jgi:hypothetical protein
MAIAQAILDRYRLLGDPVEFPFGRIYSGLDPFADRPVRVYEIPAGISGFRSGSLVEDMREGAKITHPHLLPGLADVAMPGATSYLVTASGKGLRLDRLEGDTGLTLQGGVHIARIVANLLVYCWRSQIEGLGLTPASVSLSDAGIRIDGIAEMRLLARAAGRKLEGRESDIAGFAAVLDCIIGHCRRAAIACEPLEVATAELTSSEGFEAARYVLNQHGAAPTPPGDNRRPLDAGEFLFREGDQSNDIFYVLENGLVQVIKHDGVRNEIFLEYARPGQLIGEMAVLDNQPRMATVRAVEPARLMVISGEAFRKRLATSDPVAMKLIETLSTRLRQTSEEAARLKAALGGNR